MTALPGSDDVKKIFQLCIESHHRNIDLHA
jgi:hypothetical protein